MARLGIVTIQKDTGSVYADQINSILRDLLDINYYAYENNDVRDIKESVVLLSTHLNYESLILETLDHAEIIVPKMTLRRSQRTLLDDIPEGTDAYLFNLSAEMAIDTIALLQKLGIHHINFIPTYPGSKMLDSIQYVVTPGEMELIGETDKHVVDIGIRILDLSTIMDIVARLGMTDSIDERKMQMYLEDTSPIGNGFEKLIRDKSELESQFDILLSTIDDYVVVTNQKGFIFFHCNKFGSLVETDEENLIGHHISDYIKGFDFNALYLKKNDGTEYILKIHDVDVVLEIRDMLLHGKQYYIHKLKMFSQVERKQAKLRAKLYDMGHVSRYTFDDIKGESEAIKHSIKIAKRMADSFSSVLIVGETGTGKELFAQAIHHASPRTNAPFVAVNCGVFHENLFESELFGYDEGSFTGAKKGGKQGLFEIAHNGTLFLDEIGEMDFSLQAKLLRVIQEKRIRRVGSDRIIDVDVRIIAATNRDLMEQVKSGAFRKDLYYRLNVLPITIKPLRERKKDIPVLLQSIKKDLGCHYHLSDDTLKILLEHNWDGNIRELRNIVEYLNNINEMLILPEHLPEYMMTQSDKTIVDIEQLILLILAKAQKDSLKLGRKSLSDALKNHDVYVSEQEIRPYLEKLIDKGLVISRKGRGGTQITMKGLHHINQMV